MKKESSSLVKVNIPDSTRILPRERLFQLLDNARERPITWVSGPAGSGKTSLVASYVKTRDLPCLWYQVDARDADLATFFYYMGLAAKKAAPRYRSALPLLTSEYLRGIPTFTLRYFEELFRRLKPPFTLVFDNYQDVPEHSEFHKNISHGLSAIPQGSNVIFISRSEPPPEFARLRASSQLNFIGWDELRFNLEESERFAEVKNPKRLPDVALKQIVEKTEGWAAGLVLMIEGAGAKTQAPNSSAKLAQGVVFDYFAGEVFDKLDSETRDFLLMTAFLPKITIGMAVKLTGMDNAGRILAALNRNHFFTEKHTTAEPVYQYHPLFREFLLTRMKESLSSEGVLRIQKRAAELLEEAGQVEDAAELLWESADWDRFVPFIQKHAPALAAQGRNQTLGDWLNRVPEQRVKKEPWLLYWYALSTLAIDPAQSRDYFRKAYEGFEFGRDLDGALAAWTYAVDSFMFDLGDIYQLDYWIEAFHRLKNRYPEEAPEFRKYEEMITVSMLIALAFRQPFHPDLPRWLDRAHEIALSGRDIALQMKAAQNVIICLIWLGDIQKAKLVLDSILEFESAKNIPPVYAIMIKTIAAIYYWHVADSEASLKSVAKALKISEESGLNFMAPFIVGEGVSAALTAGDIAAAKEMLSKMAPVLATPRRHEIAYYYYLNAWLLTLQGDKRCALTEIDTAIKITLQIGSPFHEALCSHLSALIHVENDELPTAFRHLEKVYSTAKGMRSLELEYGACLAYAYLYGRTGKEKDALDHLRQGMRIGRENGYRNFMGWQPKMMSFLCQKALEKGIEVEYVRELIRRRNLIPETSLIHIENWPWPTSIYTLGRFEIVKEGKPVEFSGKVQKKPLAMLKAIIALGGREAGQEQLTDILWPESEGDAAHMAFKTTLHRLRKLMGNDQAIRLQEGCLSLDDRYCWVDAFAFHQIFEKVEAMRKGGQDESRSEQLIQLAEKAMGVYRGHFLADDVAEAWAVSTRERLKNKFILLVDWLGHCYEETGQWKKAMECYENAIKADERHEEFYRRLMLCNKKLGRRAEALAVYQRCRNLFKANGIKPSPETEAIHKELRIMGS